MSFQNIPQKFLAYLSELTEFIVTPIAVVPKRGQAVIWKLIYGNAKYPANEKNVSVWWCGDAVSQDI